jgi:hypothetical protein
MMTDDLFFEVGGLTRMLYSTVFLCKEKRDIIAEGGDERKNFCGPGKGHALEQSQESIIIFHDVLSRRFV